MRKRKTGGKDFKHYHFIGIGGMGVGNLALLMLAKGYKVSGSDARESELTRQLREKGVNVFIGHDMRHIDGADCVVYSSAIGPTNPEMAEAVCRHMPLLKRAELLAQLVNREVGITVAGAHGKTTTSSMASLLLVNAGLKPSTAVGGVVAQGYNANLGIGRHFVAEVDESDGSFLYFNPHFSIITNVDAEHLDYYHNFDNIKEAYAKFVGNTAPDGLVIACGDDQNLHEIVEKGGRRAVYYGFGANNDWTASAIQCDANGSAYECYHKGVFYGHFRLTVPGKHNVLNSLAIVALGEALQISRDAVADTLRSFQCVKRRFQRKGEAGGVLVVDDYGHHPTEIAVTLQTAKTLDRKRVVVAFQPHRYTRTKFLLNEFADCFSLADQVFITDIYAASEKPIEGVTAQGLVDKVLSRKLKGVSYVRREAMLDELMAFIRPGDLVLTLGAGDITQISDEIVQRIEGRCGFDRIPASRQRSSEELKSLGLIGVVMGGCSSERDVSLRSGAAVVKALTEAGCQVKALDLTTEDPGMVKEWFRAEKVDVVFIALHGRFGEDGALQAILDEIDIPYQGCSPVASFAAFDKAVAQKQFESRNVRTPRSLVFRSGSDVAAGNVVHELGGFPVVVKPACEGSSIGVALATDEASFREAFRTALGFGRDVIVQEYIRGRELTVGILGHCPLPIVEVCAQADFFDFQAKYQSTTTNYVVPAGLPVPVAQAVQAEALKAYKALGCEGFGRVDVLIDQYNTPFILEINTIPGFTATSLLPKAAKAAGLDFQQLCLTLIEMAYGKKKVESVHQH